MINDQPLTIIVDGQTIPLGLDAAQPLVRAVIISLFSWARAKPDDDLPAGPDNFGRMGWWGDSFPSTPNDCTGSRLWLLSRSTLIPETVAQSKEYAQEALQWLIDDGVAARVEVQAERQGLSTLALGVQIYKSDGTRLVDVRFTDVWEFLNV
jgi:phage gp46-like protein